MYGPTCILWADLTPFSPKSGGPFASITNTQPMGFWGHSCVNYSQPAPAAAFAFYDYLLSWGASRRGRVCHSVTIFI